MTTAVVEVVVEPTPVIEVVVSSVTAVEVAVPGQPGPRGLAGPDPWDEMVQVIIVDGPVAIDYGLGKHVRLTVMDDTLITVFGWPPEDRVARLTLEIENTGAHLVQWPAAVLWDDGDAPVVPPSSRGIYVLSSSTGGAVIFGNIIGRNYLPAE